MNRFSLGAGYFGQTLPPTSTVDALGWTLMTSKACRFQAARILWLFCTANHRSHKSQKRSTNLQHPGYRQATSHTLLRTWLTGHQYLATYTAPHPLYLLLSNLRIWQDQKHRTHMPGCLHQRTNAMHSTISSLSLTYLHRLKISKSIESIFLLSL